MVSHNNPFWLTKWLQLSQKPNAPVHRAILEVSSMIFVLGMSNCYYDVMSCPPSTGLGLFQGLTRTAGNDKLGESLEPKLEVAFLWNYGTSLCVLDPQCFQRWMPSTIPALPQLAWLDSSVLGTSPSIFSHSRLPLRLQLDVQWCANLVRWPLSLPTCWQRSWMKQVCGRWAASSIQDFVLILSGFQKIVYLYFKDCFYQRENQHNLWHWLTEMSASFYCSVLCLYLSCFTLPFVFTWNVKWERPGGEGSCNLVLSCVDSYVDLQCTLTSCLGLPPGVCNIVFGLGPRAGEAIVKHPNVPLISFTGSTAIGERIQRLSSPYVKRLSLEVRDTWT